jgi:ribonuclease D
MKPVNVVENSTGLAVLVEELTAHEHIAVDTESNSFYAYFERVCLIQISTGEEDYIIDPVVVKDLSPLGKVFESPEIEKIFHAAPNDVLGLKRDFQFQFRNVFDTAVSCKLLGYKHLGLARIIERHFGVALNKKRWQRCDWGKRPLKPEQIDYARMDTHFLIPLRHRLAEDLASLDLSDMAKVASEKACQQEVPGKSFQPEGYIQISGAKSLDDVGKRVLKGLYLYRDQVARRRNRAPFRIISNETLLRLSTHRPKDLKGIAEIKGLPRSYNHGPGAHRLLKLIKKNEDHEGPVPLLIEDRS